MEIEKGKIPKGLSFVLKSSMLEKSLKIAKIDTNVHLIYDPRHSFFEAFYWLPNENVPYERFYIRTGAVDAHIAKEAREYMVNRVLPEFITWAEEINRLPSNSPKLQERPHFSRCFQYE